MSIVIYGPMACGKTRNAEVFRKHYGCESVIDTGRFEYPKTFGQMEKFKSENILYLTDELPPINQSNFLRYIPFNEACKQAGVKS